MPFVLRPPIRKARFSIALGVSALAFVAFPAFASAADCPDEPSSQIFSIYGDDESYSPVPNGDFDFSTAGWTLERAKPNAADSLKLKDAPHLAKDGKSLKMDRQSYAVSPPVCVSVLHPSFRLFAYKKGGGRGDLNVRLLYQTSEGDYSIIPVGSLDSEDYRSWSLTPSLPLWSALPLAEAETAEVRLVFDYGFLPNGDPERGVKNQWRIDEIYVDPYRR
jgi:hypothetical protein